MGCMYFNAADSVSECMENRRDKLERDARLIEALIHEDIEDRDIDSLHSHVRDIDEVLEELADIEESISDFGDIIDDAVDDRIAARKGGY